MAVGVDPTAVAVSRRDRAEQAAEEKLRAFLLAYEKSWEQVAAAEKVGLSWEAPELAARALPWFGEAFARVRRKHHLVLKDKWYVRAREGNLTAQKKILEAEMESFGNSLTVHHNVNFTVSKESVAEMRSEWLVGFSHGILEAEIIEEAP